MEPTLNNNLINEKNHPVQPRWVIKRALSYTIIAVIAVFVLAPQGISALGNPDFSIYAIYFYIGFLILAPIFSLIQAFLERKTLHYSFDEEFINVTKGIISIQNRRLPYIALQNVVVKKDLLDLLFNLTSVQIQNASQVAVTRKLIMNNTVTIPGLTSTNAEAIRNFVMEKIKQNPKHTWI